MMSGGAGGGVKKCFLGLWQTALLSAEGKNILHLLSQLLSFQRDFSIFFFGFEFFVILCPSFIQYMTAVYSCNTIHNRAPQNKLIIFSAVATTAAAAAVAARNRLGERKSGSDAPLKRTQGCQEGKH
jgi:hypothetical protein